MVDTAAALSVTFTFVGAFVFVVLKFFVAKMLKGWKGLILKAVISFVLAALSGLVWNICPSLSVILVFGVLIIGELIGFGIIYIAQSLPYIGGTVSYAFSMISYVVVIWIVIAVIGFLLDVLSIVALFVPVFGWIADVIILIVSLLLPVIQIAVAWGAFSSQFAGLADCILGTGRTAAIPGTGGIHLGATK